MKNKMRYKLLEKKSQIVFSVRVNKDNNYMYLLVRVDSFSNFNVKILQEMQNNDKTGYVFVILQSHIHIGFVTLMDTIFTHSNDSIYKIMFSTL